MRVTAQSSFTAVITGGQMLDVKPGDVFTGDVATYLLRSGADVTEADEQTDEQVNPEEEVEETEESGELNIDGKIEDVLAWVGDDPERALEAHSAEEARGDKARSTLLAKLAELVDKA